MSDTPRYDAIHIRMCEDSAPDYQSYCDLFAEAAKESEQELAEANEKLKQADVQDLRFRITEIESMADSMAGLRESLAAVTEERDALQEKLRNIFQWEQQTSQQPPPPEDS